MKATNILKIVDIEDSQLKADFTQWLQKEIEPTYKDQELKEHIYNPDTILDNQQDQGSPYPPQFVTELEQIKTVCAENEAGYFRIVF